MQEYKEYHTDTEVHFQLFFTAAKLQEVLSGTGAHQKLKLIGKASIGELRHSISIMLLPACLHLNCCPAQMLMLQNRCLLV